MEKVYLRGNFEQIIADEGFDGFFAFSEIMSMIRGKPIQLSKHALLINGRSAGEYDLNHHLTNKYNLAISLFEELRSRIVSLDNQINERFNKIFINYSRYKSFCQISIQKNQVKVWVNLDIHEINDPFSLCRDVRKVGHQASGSTELFLRSFQSLEAVFDIIQQAYKKNLTFKRRMYTFTKSIDTKNLRLEFWTQLLEKAKQHTNLHANISPTHFHWIGAGAGISGISYNYIIRTHDGKGEVYIDKGNRDWNKETFDTLYQHKDDIERAFGAELDWRKLEDKRASRIQYVIGNYGLMDRNYWPELQDLMIEGMIRFHRSLQPYINDIRKSKKNHVRGEKVYTYSIGSRETMEIRKEFWGQLLAKAKEKTNLHANISPSGFNWSGAGAGIGGLSYNYYIRMNNAQLDIYIDRGNRDWNKETFNYFYQNKNEIEEAFGAELEWLRLDDKRASRIQHLIPNPGKPEPNRLK
jgi:predicted transport protein